MKMINRLTTALVLLFAAATIVSAQTNPAVKPRKITTTKPRTTARTQQRKSTQPKTDPDVIVFKQPSVEAVCLRHFDINRDGRLTKQEAAEVMVFPEGIFKENKDITYFDELQYFTALKRIPDWAFWRCSNLMRITLPEGIDAIGKCAFWECVNLTLVNIPSSVRRIGEMAFNDCKNLSCPIVIPEGVRVIEKRTFGGCTYVPSITLPSTLKEIGASAFSGCANLSCPIVIPEGVRVIGEWAFSGCSNVPSITLPSTLTEINEAAFYKCESMTRLTIPAGVQVVRDFYADKNLTELHFMSATPPKFYGSHRNYIELSEYATVYVPRGSLEAYKNWGGLNNFKGTIVEE